MNLLVFRLFLSMQLKHKHVQKRIYSTNIQDQKYEDVDKKRKYEIIEDRIVKRMSISKVSRKTLEHQ